MLMFFLDNGQFPGVTAEHKTLILVQGLDHMKLSE